MNRDPSKDDLCRVPTSELAKESEKIFTAKLIPPVLLVCSLIYFLKTQYEYYKEKMDEDRPFRDVWWSGPIFFSIFYLLVVYFGVKAMENRAEFKIKPYIFAYNMYQCVINLYGFIAMYQEVFTNPVFKGFWGNDIVLGAPSFKIGFLVWLHYNNKYVELLDTLWMILRKKNKQISFLHCYHHVLLVWSWFLVCKIEVGGDSYFGASINSFIHVIMYGYYTLALLGIPCPWKKFITSMQLAQFTLVACHSCYCFYAQKAPFILAAHQLFVMLNMLVLFSKFFWDTYSKKKSDKKVAKSD